MACDGKCKAIHKGAEIGCGNEHSDGWSCTQPKLHKGDHIACNSMNCNLMTWPPVSFVTKSQVTSPEETKFELVLNAEEAKVLMGYIGRLSGETKRGKLLHGIYHALSASGCNSASLHTRVNNGVNIVYKDD